MSNYFQKFPTTSVNINGTSKTITDISYAYNFNLDTIEQNTINVSSYSTIGNAAYNLYQQAENFWAFLVANEEINPWAFTPETPGEYQKRNLNYASAVLKAGGGKNNIQNYVDLFPGDIIVPTTQVTSVGITAADALFDFAALDLWYVQNAFYDTKKAKITQNLNPGATSSRPDLADPNIIEESQKWITIRKGLTGYFVVQTQNTATFLNLKSYSYLESPAAITTKTNNSKISTFTLLDDDSDSIFNVIENDSPTGTASAELTELYNVLPTSKVQQRNYAQQANKKFIPAGSFSKILTSLI